MKAVVAAFNQEKALVGAFSVITNLRMKLFEALLCTDLTCRTAHYEQPRLLKQLPPQQHLGSPGFESEYKLLFRLKISAVLRHLSVSSGRWWMRDKVWLDCSPA